MKRRMWMSKIECRSFSLAEKNLLTSFGEKLQFATPTTYTMWLFGQTFFQLEAAIYCIVHCCYRIYMYNKDFREDCDKNFEFDSLLVPGTKRNYTFPSALNTIQGERAKIWLLIILLLQRGKQRWQISILKWKYLGAPNSSISFFARFTIVQCDNVTTLKALYIVRF